MSELTDFLMEHPVDDIRETVRDLSPRLKGFSFQIKAMSGQEYSDYQRMSTIIGKRAKGGTDFNGKKFNELVVINHVMTPSFKDAELLKKAGVTTSEQFLYKSLLAGEINTLAMKIMELSGFHQDMEELVEEGKNY